MESKSAESDVVRKIFAAYESKDRKSIEDLLTDDFTFSSPLDDHIDRATYFERCWPNSEKIKAFTIEKFFRQGDEVFVRYVSELYNGALLRNTEFFRVKGGKIAEVDVYFGRTLRAASQK